jgi:hypothetical protein
MQLPQGETYLAIGDYILDRCLEEGSDHWLFEGVERNSNKKTFCRLLKEGSQS